MYVIQFERGNIRMENEAIVKGLLKNIMGDLAGGKSEDYAFRAFEMGQQYATNRRFDNSRFYHNYQYRLDDGTRISSTSYFNQFMILLN